MDQASSGGGGGEAAAGREKKSKSEQIIDEIMHTEMSYVKDLSEIINVCIALHACVCLRVLFAYLHVCNYRLGETHTHTHAYTQKYTDMEFYQCADIFQKYQIFFIVGLHVNI